MLTTSVKKATPLSLSNILAGSSGTSGFSNGTGTAARFSSPSNMVYDGDRNLYVSDTGNHSIRKITPVGVVTTYAGTGSSGSNNANGTSASFNTPAGLAFDSSSNLYVADSGNNLIRKITTARDVTTVAFAVTGAQSLAVSSDGSNMAAVNSTSNVRYYIGGVDLGAATGGLYPLTSSVAYSPNGSFYRTPADANGVNTPGLLRVSIATGTSNQTTSGDVTTTLMFGTTYEVSMTISGTNNFATGTVVSFSGFTPSLLNLSGITLVGGTTTGLGGTVRYQRDFGQALSGPYNTQGTVSRITLTETQTVLTTDGASYGTYFSQVSFQSDTIFCGMTTGSDFLRYTLAGDTATSNATASAGENPTLFAVKSSNSIEFAYPDGNAVNIYNKKY